MDPCLKKILLNLLISNLLKVSKHQKDKYKKEKNMYLELVFPDVSL